MKVLLLVVGRGMVKKMTGIRMFRLCFVVHGLILI